MISRCIFVTLVSLHGSCLSTPPLPDTAFAAAPPENRTMPRLPASDAGLAPEWFLGNWRVENSACTLSLERHVPRANSGAVTPHGCTVPWGNSSDWRKPDDRSSLFEIRDDAGHILWRAYAIQPTTIAGMSGEGSLIRLHWMGEGVHGGWMQPMREPKP